MKKKNWWRWKKNERVQESVEMKGWIKERGKKMEQQDR